MLPTTCYLLHDTCHLLPATYHAVLTHAKVWDYTHANIYACRAVLAGGTYRIIPPGAYLMRDRPVASPSRKQRGESSTQRGKASKVKAVVFLGFLTNFTSKSTAFVSST